MIRFFPDELYSIARSVGPHLLMHPTLSKQILSWQTGFIFQWNLVAKLV
jgi:hypothetical protein|tara:strand:- start:1318 stop:1464 length:147 start_codon:yes stop_codon:yes gene_type:complete